MAKLLFLTFLIQIWLYQRCRGIVTQQILRPVFFRVPIGTLTNITAAFVPRAPYPEIAPRGVFPIPFDPVTGTVLEKAGPRAAH